MTEPLDPGLDLRRGRYAGAFVGVAVAAFLCLLAILGLSGRGAHDATLVATPGALPPLANELTAAQASGAGTGSPAEAAARPSSRRALVQPASRDEVSVRRTRFGVEAAAKRNDYFASPRDDQGFARLGEPRPGDWLWEFKERGQTLQEYLQAGVNRKNTVRSRFHVQPYSDLKPPQRQVVAAVREHVAAFFDSEVVVLPERRPVPLWYHQGRKQWDADVAVRSLAGQVPEGSLGLLGLMGSDLYGLRLNFIFGVGLMRERAALYSLHRYDSKDERLLARRAAKVAVHELGHVLTLKHCIFYRCVMNGSNSVAEMDAQPMHACPVCLAKLRANLRFDPRARYERLEALFRRQGLAPDAAFVRARLRELSAAAAAPAAVPATGQATAAR
jgi:archaemetzincin